MTPDDQMSGLEWQVDDVVADLYLVTAILGEGGMGRVYRVRHLGWNLDLAVKSPHLHVLDEQGRLEFIREAETWVNLGLHPHSVTCYYVRTLAGVPRLFSEYVSGGSLRDWIRDDRLWIGGQVTRILRIIDVAIQTAWGLSHAHSHGLAHHDVKPANVMMTPDGTAKITDFGLARAPHAGTEAGGLPAYTLEYASPEQVDGLPLTVSTDIWSWALMVVEMFAGQMPTLGLMASVFLDSFLDACSDNPNLPTMPEALVALLRRCFELDPERRPASMDAIASELLELYADVGQTPYHRPLPALMSSSADSLNNQAVSLLDLQRVGEARRHLERAVGASTHHLQASYNLGLLQWRCGELSDEQLLTRLRDWRMVHRDSWELAYGQAMVHIERGDEKAADAHLAYAARAGGGDPFAEALLRKAASLLRRGFVSLGTLSGHEDFVHCLALTPNGHWVISAGRDRVVRVWDAYTRRCVRTLRGHRGAILGLCATDRRVVSASSDGTVRLWDLDKGRLERTLTGHTGSIPGVAIGGGRILSGGEDGTMRLWPESVFHVEEAVRTVALSPDAALACAGTVEGRIQVWRVADHTRVHTLEAHTGAVQAMAITPDGQRLLSAGADGFLRIWDLHTAECQYVLEGDGGAIDCLALSSDGLKAATSGEKGSVCFWDLQRPYLRRTLMLGMGRLYAVAVNGDFRYAVCGGAFTDLHALKIARSGAEALPLLARPESTESLLSAEEKFTQAVSLVQRAIRRQDWFGAVTALKRARRMPGYEGDETCVALGTQLSRYCMRGPLQGIVPLFSVPAGQQVAMSGDGSLAVSSAADGRVTAWELASRTPLTTLLLDTPPTALSLTRDGNVLLVTTRDGVASKWDLRDGTECWRVGGLGNSALAMTPHGEWWAAASRSGYIEIHDGESGAVQQQLGGFGDYLALTPDGRRLACSSPDGTLRVWDVSSGDCLSMVTDEGARALQISADGRTVLFTGDDGKLHTFDVESGRLAGLTKGHVRPGLALAATPDGCVAVTGSKDRSLLVWDVKRKQVAACLEGHGDWVGSVCISNNGRLVLSAGRDGAMRMWYLDWELQAAAAADWHEDVRTCLEVFLRQHPIWSDEVFPELLEDLSDWGYGWVQPTEVYAQAQRAAAKRDLACPGPDLDVISGSRPLPPPGAPSTAWSTPLLRYGT